MNVNAPSIANPLIEGNITKSIFRLALPVVASTALHNVFHIADTWWISRFLGKEATAAMGSSGFLVWGVFSLGTMVSVGVHAMVARFTGAGDRRTTGEAAYQGFIIAAAFSIIIAVLGLSFRGPLFAFLKTEEAVTGFARDYLQVILSGAGTVFLFVLITGIFRALGDTTTPLLLLLAAGLINFFLDPMLILGWGPFPKLGIVGAAVATVFSRTMGVAMGLYLLLRYRGDGKIDWHISRWRPSFKMHWRIIRIGFPSSLAGFLFCVVYMFLIRLIADVAGDHKTATVAALTIGFRVESLSFMWAIGFSSAAATLVGQNLGAGKPDRAAKCAWQSAGFLCAIVSVVGMAMVVFSKSLVSIFIDDPEVIRIAASYVVVMGIIQVPQSLAGVLRGAFSGAGNTLPNLLINAPLNFARVPLGYLLAGPLGWGIYGIWWAIGISSVTKGITMGAWFYRGKWKHHEV